MLDIAYLNELRRLEMDEILPHLPPRSRILEFGSGTGEQARFLAERGFDVVAIDLASSNYAKDRVFPVQDYDGRHIPLEDHSIDVIFSSNVLEHVENLDEISAEFRRVLKAGGLCVHAMPTTAWRFWTFASGVADSVKAAGGLPASLIRQAAAEGRGQQLTATLRRIGSGFLPRGHGTSPEGLSELWTFSRHAWLRKFQRVGFEVIRDWPVGFFYTGSVLLGSKLKFSRRRRLSRFFGSGTRIYLLKPNDG